jgi:hypothetical protein
MTCDEVLNQIFSPIFPTGSCAGNDRGLRTEHYNPATAEMTLAGRCDRLGVDQRQTEIRQGRDAKLMVS